MGSSFPKGGLKGRFWGKHELPLLCCEPRANLSKPRTKRNREPGSALVVSHSGTSGGLTSVCAVWEQCTSPWSCLPPRWGGQLFMQQLHSSDKAWFAFMLASMRTFEPSEGNSSCGLCWVKSLCDLIAQSLSPRLRSVGADCWRCSCYQWEPSPTSPSFPPCRGTGALLWHYNTGN